MSVSKSEIACLVYHKIGASIDDALEQARKDVSLAQGANVGLVQSAKKVEKLSIHVDSDLDDGKYDGLNSLEIAKLIKGYLQRATVVLESDAISFEQRRLMAEGRCSAFQQNVTMTKKLYDVESRKVELLKEAESEESEDSSNSNGRSQRAVGVRPGATVKERRLLEESSNSLTGETSPKPKVKVRRLASNGNNT